MLVEILDFTELLPGTSQACESIKAQQNEFETFMKRYFERNITNV